MHKSSCTHSEMSICWHNAAAYRPPSAHPNILRLLVISFRNTQNVCMSNLYLSILTLKIEVRNAALRLLDAARHYTGQTLHTQRLCQNSAAQSRSQTCWKLHLVSFCFVTHLDPIWLLGRCHSPPPPHPLPPPNAPCSML